MITLEITTPAFFDLDLIMKSEQCPASLYFWHRKQDETFTRAFRTSSDCLQVVLSQIDNHLVVNIHGKDNEIHQDDIPEVINKLKYQYRLDQDNTELLEQFKQWPEIFALIEQYPGLQLMRDDELLPRFVDSLCSQNTSITHLNSMMDNITRKYGQFMKFASGDILPIFPSIGELSKATEEELRECRLGYRAKYVDSVIKHLVQTPMDTDTLAHGNLEDAYHLIQALPGIGPKVGGLILMYGFGRTDVFPVDLWVKRALTDLYGWEGSIEQLQIKAEERFGQLSGYVSNYLFYLWRSRLYRQLPLALD